MTDKLLTKDDNPKWTTADFARAKRDGDIPEAIRKAFPKKPGRRAGETKAVS